jgi:hypothetical protein
VSTRFCKLCLLVICAGYGGFLSWQESAFRKSLAAPLSFAATDTTASPREPLDTTAVATVLGLVAETTLLPSAEPLTLHASFVVGTGLSRALLAGTQGSRIYQVGDSLPGGSVLRRVEANQAVLWNKGREEVLTLQTPVSRFLRRFGASAEAPTPAKSTHFLRSLPGQSE